MFRLGKGILVISLALYLAPSAWATPIFDNPFENASGYRAYLGESFTATISSSTDPCSYCPATAVTSFATEGHTLSGRALPFDGITGEREATLNVVELTGRPSTLWIFRFANQILMRIDEEIDELDFEVEGLFAPVIEAISSGAEGFSIFSRAYGNPFTVGASDDDLSPVPFDVLGIRG